MQKRKTTLIDLLPQNLASNVHQLIQEYPKSEETLLQILEFFTQQKKQKSESSATATATSTATASVMDNSSMSNSFQNVDLNTVIADISIQIPIRKKISLGFSDLSLYIFDSSQKDSWEMTTVHHQISFQDLDTVLLLPSTTSVKPQWNIYFHAKNPALIVNFPDSLNIKSKMGDLDVSKPSSLEILIQLLKQNKIYSIFGYPGKFLNATTLIKDLENIYLNGYMKAKEVIVYILQEGLFIGWKKPIYWIPSFKIIRLEISSLVRHTIDIKIIYRDTENKETNQLKEDSKESVIFIEMIDAQTQDTLMEFWKSNRISPILFNGEEVFTLQKMDKGKGKATDIQDSWGEDDENDLDFQPSDEDDVPEEFDSEYASEGIQEDEDSEQENSESEENSEHDLGEEIVSEEETL